MTVLSWKNPSRQTCLQCCVVTREKAGCPGTLHSQAYDRTPVHFLLDIWNSHLLTTEITRKNILEFSTIIWRCIFCNLFHLATVNLPPLMLSAGIQVISRGCVIINSYSFSLLPSTSGPVHGFSRSKLPHNYMICSLASLILWLMCQGGLLHLILAKRPRSDWEAFCTHSNWKHPSPR